MRSADIVGQKHGNRRNRYGKQDRQDDGDHRPPVRRFGLRQVLLTDITRSGEVRFRRQSGAIVERNHVRALRHLDYKSVLRAFGRVVLGQFQAKPASLNADGGIVLRIEVVRTSKNLGCDLVLLQRRTGMIKCVLAQITKQFAKRFRSVKHLAVNEFVNFSQVPLAFGNLSTCNRHLT